MKCKEKAGFLISHPCPRPPSMTCCICGKDVCNDHSRETDDGFACVTCYKGKHVDEDLRAGATGRRYYQDPYYYGYYHSYRPYGLHDSFDDRDRDAFGSAGDGDVEGVEADADGS